MGIYRCAFYSTSATFTQTVSPSVYTPAIYETVQNTGPTFAADTTYFSVGSAPYSVITVNQQTDVFITCNVTWGQTNTSGRYVCIQLKKNGSANWITIGGQSTIVTAVETATSWKSTNVLMPWRVFQGDQLRAAYYVGASLTITPGQSVANSRQYPSFSVMTNIINI